MIVRLQLALGVLAVVFSLPGFGSLSPQALERELQRQMNDGTGRYVTEKVSCVRASTAARGGAKRYSCSLDGVDATPLRVRVDVTGGQWRAFWPPASG